MAFLGSAFLAAGLAAGLAAVLAAGLAAGLGAGAAGAEAAEDLESLMDDLLRLSSACLFSLAPLTRVARSLAYSVDSSLFLARRARFRARLCLLRWSIVGVTSRWILGALVTGFLDLEFSLGARGLLMTYWRTSSSLDRLKSLRILVALLGPRRRGTALSVRPGISLAPFLTIVQARTDRDPSTMQPRTDFLFRSPSRRGRKQEWPLLIRRRTRSFVRTPCFMGKPCLSLPPVILRTYPLNSSPTSRRSTNAPMRFSMNTRILFSSSMSKSFWHPVAG